MSKGRCWQSLVGPQRLRSHIYISYRTWPDTRNYYSVSFYLEFHNIILVGIFRCASAADAVFTTATVYSAIGIASGHLSSRNVCTCTEFSIWTIRDNPAAMKCYVQPSFFRATVYKTTVWKIARVDGCCSRNEWRVLAF